VSTPKVSTPRTARQAIAAVIALKSTIELVRDAIVAIRGLLTYVRWLLLQLPEIANALAGCVGEGDHSSRGGTGSSGGGTGNASLLAMVHEALRHPELDAVRAAIDGVVGHTTVLYLLG
jgi:hypothetical protein